jgi:hypothetical protein
MTVVQVCNSANKRGLKPGRAGYSRRPSLAVALRFEGRDIIASLKRIVPECAAQWDIIQSAAALFLEGAAASLELAASLARRQHWREYPVLGAPVSLDAPIWEGGPALIERISRGLWD